MGYNKVKCQFQLSEGESDVFKINPNSGTARHQYYINGRHVCMQDWQNNVTTCRPRCENGSFSLHGMVSCEAWLTCEDIREDVEISSVILGQGAVKMVNLGEWNSHSVAVSQLRTSKYTDDFVSNLELFAFFNAGGDEHFLKHIVQMIGFCSHDSKYILVTEYHSFGSADNLDFILQTHLPRLNTLATRFSLCLDFVSILHQLHTHKDGTRVFCDSNTPEKFLSQFLLSSDLKLLLNDMDALPLLSKSNNYSIKCGHKELFGEHVAPEQLWPYDETFDDNLMPSYNEKVDIWKVPDVCLSLIGNSKGFNRLFINLFNIHAECKNELAHLRPSAGEILQVYESVQKMLGLD